MKYKRNLVLAAIDLIVMQRAASGVIKRKDIISLLAHSDEAKDYKIGSIYSAVDNALRLLVNNKNIRRARPGEYK